MNEKFDELKKIIDLCRKSGIKSIKFQDISLEFSSDALFPESAYKQKKKEKETAAIPDPLQTLAEQEQALFWSSANIGEAPQ